MQRLEMCVDRRLRAGMMEQAVDAVGSGGGACVAPTCFVVSALRVTSLRRRAQANDPAASYRTRPDESAAACCKCSARDMDVGA